jgi:hypothetical protein
MKRLKMTHPNGETMFFHPSKRIEMEEKGWEIIEPVKKKVKPSKKQRVKHGNSNSL